jgi:hypothetical protein
LIIISEKDNENDATTRSGRAIVMIPSFSFKNT